MHGLPSTSLSWRRMARRGNRWPPPDLKPGARPADLRRAADRADSLTWWHAGLQPTHELLPIAEHPLMAPGAIQVAGFYAPPARLRQPRRIPGLREPLPCVGLGCCSTGFPGHFPKDSHGLAFSIGCPSLMSIADPRIGESTGMGHLDFNYSRNEVPQTSLCNF